MEEETTPQEEVKEEPKATTMIESANKAAEELKVENDRMQKLVAELKELQAIKTLGGETSAGEQPTPTKEETPSEYNKRLEKELRDGTFNAK